MRVFGVQFVLSTEEQGIFPPEDVYAGSRALCFSASIRKTRVI